MRISLIISRFLVGVLFIISGLIKANDTIGFSYKLAEYFEVFGMEWLSAFALLIAVSICVFEILLGTMLLIGSRIKFVSWSLLLMIVFFTFLTFFSAYFNKVTDCGCFGDALKLTPWQSFTKDMVLLFFILLLFKSQNKIQSLFTKKAENKINLLTLLLSCYFVWHTYSHLPAKDFRPYAIGENIPEGMLIPKDAKQDIIEDIWYYEINGETQQFTTEQEPWKIEGAKYVDRKTKLIEKGYEPPIHDFSISKDEVDITDSILSAKKAYLVIAYNIKKTNAEASKKLTDLYLACEKKEITFVALSASSD
ncbi:MAG: DoxX family protein, partial [Flavobacteriales bacterium]|nr:DoxX family protein [Flavobacteriales bacterium]